MREMDDLNEMQEMNDLDEMDEMEDKIKTRVGMTLVL